MGIIKCEKGHFYDDVKYESCPHCQMEANKPALSDNNDRTIAKISGDMQRRNLASFVAADEERTVGLYKKDTKGKLFDPVVGWLVCVDGPEKGRDYRIVSGQNFVGRAHQMDITISDDPAVSKEKHCSIVFDPRSSRFSFVPGSSISYYNDELINTPVELKMYDKITIGSTVLQFVPYCKEGVAWI